MLNKCIIFCFISLLLLAKNSYAVDIGVLQEQCAEIGFKIKTAENGKCVLRLMKSVASQQAKIAIQQKAYAQEQQYKRESEARATNQQIMQRQAQASQQPVEQQNEEGVGTTMLQGLVGVVQLLGAAAQGYSQGMRQSAPIPSYQPTTAHCNSALSPLSKQVETTCTQY